MIIIERMVKARGEAAVRDVCSMTYWQALAIGFAQCLAMWPGTSRSMVTIVAALLLGVHMLAAAEFSFLLALPTLGAATLYSGYKARDALVASAGWDGLAVGLVVSAITAALAVKLFVAWLTRHGLAPFGVYRLLLAGALLWYFVGR
jgi:undecaprenyl-diphosphatase